MDSEAVRWHSVGLMHGAATIVAPEYPFQFELAVAQAAGPVEISVERPIVDTSSDPESMQQLIAVTFSSVDSAACNIAAEALLIVADITAFLSERPVEVDIGGVTTAPPNAVGGKYTRISRGILAIGTPDSRSASSALLHRLLTTTMSRPAIARSVRWLRRADTTKDIVLRFAALAFGLEALVLELGDPPGAASNNSTAKRLRYLAVETCTVPEGTWRRVWQARNSLFHGGLMESEDMRETVAFAAGWAAFVLVSGIKRLIGLQPSDLPHPARPRSSMRGVHMTIEGPAEHMWLRRHTGAIGDL